MLISYQIPPKAELDPVIGTGTSSEDTIGGILGTAVALLLVALLLVYGILTTTVIIIRRHPMIGREAAKSGDPDMQTMECAAYGQNELVQQPPPIDVQQDYEEVQHN